MKWKNKKLGVLLIASILISSLLTYQLALSSVPASGPYYLDVPFGTASYYVGKFDNGSTYMVDGDTWQCTWQSDNSSAVINACIGNTSVSKGNVFIKSADYMIDSPIIHKSNVDVYMEEGVYIKLADGSNCHLWENDDNEIGESGNENMTISGGHLDGNKAGQGDAVTISVINFTHVAHVKIEDVRVSNGDVHGITMWGAEDFSIEDCFIENWDWNGISTGQGGGAWDASNDGWIHKNRLEGGSDVAIQIGECWDINVNLNTIIGCNGSTGDSNSGWGIGLEGAPTDITIDNNEISWCKSGIWVDASAGAGTDNVITNNKLRKIGSGSGQLGIRLDTGCDRHTIQGNKMSDWNTASYGIYVGSSYNIISNNMLGDKPIQVVGGDLNVIEGNEMIDSSYGVWLQSSADDNVVNDNLVWEVSEGYRGIWVESGSRNLIEGNKVKIIGGGSIGIYIQAGSDNIVRNNELTQCTTPVSNGGTNTIIKGNAGFVTENSGTQTCADNENIAHGLAGTPTMVTVTPMNDTYDGVPVIATVDWSNVDATNIQVGLYWVNGTAITDDVILVSWYVKYEP